MPRRDGPSVNQRARRRTTVLAYLRSAGRQHTGIFLPAFTDFGIVLPAGATPTNWAPGGNPSSPIPQVLDNDHPWSDWGIHPNLWVHNVWDPTNWIEPDGSSFFGWRFENRDENLQRWLLATFEWDAPPDAPDVVLGTVLSGVGQWADIGPLPGNESATILTRRITGNYSPTPPADLIVTKVDMSRWRLQNTGVNSGFAAKISGPHQKLSGRLDKLNPQVIANYIEYLPGR